MLQYENIDVSKGTDINKSNKSKGCMIWHYWYFKDIGYKFEQHVCNKCHDISMMVYELKNTAIVNGKGVNCRCALRNMNKNYAINMLGELNYKGVHYEYGFWCK